MATPVPLLTDDERQRLVAPERLDIGSYHTWNPVRECAFVIDLDARLLAALVEDAAIGKRAYEFMMIRRPGDVLRYLWVRFVDVDKDLAQSIDQHLTGKRNGEHFVDEPLGGPWTVTYMGALPFVEFDGCFKWDNEDTPPPDAAWRSHREGKYWRSKTRELLALVQSLQERLRGRDDSLLQHELFLIDASQHRRDFLADPLGNGWPRPVSGRAAPVPAAALSAILDLIQRDDVRSVSCPFDDFTLWRALIEKQLRRAEATGLPLQSAFGLCGPDSGLPGIPVEDWGGEVHIPYEGACGADLFILPSWHRFFADKVRDGGKLRWAVGKPCHHVLLQGDHGELACATRTTFGDWTLYTSTVPYEDCSPFLDRELDGPVNSEGAD